MSRIGKGDFDDIAQQYEEYVRLAGLNDVALKLQRNPYEEPIRSDNQNVSQYVFVSHAELERTS